MDNFEQIETYLKVAVRMKFKPGDKVKAINFVRNWARTNFNKITEPFVNWHPAYNLVNSVLKGNSSELHCITRLKALLAPYNVKVDAEKYELTILLSAPEGFVWVYNKRINLQMDKSYIGNKMNEIINTHMRFIKMGIYEVNNPSNVIKFGKQKVCHVHSEQENK